MATLTEVSIVTRKILTWIAIGLIAYLILRILFGLGVAYWKAQHPVKPAPPNVLFGPIPLPDFPDSLQSTAGLKLTLLTIEGGPPEATNTGKVYFMPKKLPSLLAPQNAQETASRLHFDSGPEIISSSDYVFHDSTRTFELDIVNNNFKYSYDYKTNPAIFKPNSVFSTNTALSEAISFFNSTGVVSDSMLSRNTVTLLSYSSSSSAFTVVSKPEDANSARVDYFRPDLDGLQLLPPEFDKSYTYAIISPSSDDLEKVAEAHYSYWPVDTNNFGTYPLRSSASAWKDIEDGKGVVASFGSNPKDHEIIVRQAGLAYYDSGLPESYLQPIFVFEGDNGFAAYITAIDSKYLVKAAQ